jgi:hypothetical protein
MSQRAFSEKQLYEYSCPLLSYASDSQQSLLHGPLVVREISSCGPPIPVQVNILSFAEH